MNIRIQGEPQEGKVMMLVYLDVEGTPNNAEIDLYVDYDDSMKVLRENTHRELIKFLEKALVSANDLSL